MQKVGIVYGHLEFTMTIWYTYIPTLHSLAAIWYVQFPFWYIKKNVATLMRIIIVFNGIYFLELFHMRWP
jgi:hypothetical protein